MRYKTQVSNKLDQILNVISNIERGLERKALSPQEILDKTRLAKQVTEDTIELVDKENEDRMNPVQTL